MYTVDENLPWFTDVQSLEDNVYVNILSSIHADDDNPNGLYYGFISNNVFFTSIWVGDKFKGCCIPVKDIESYLYVEYFSLEEEAIEEPEKSPEEKTFYQWFKEELEQDSINNDKPSVKSPLGFKYYDNSKYSFDNKDLKEALEKIKRSPTTNSSLSYKDLQDIISNVSQVFKTKG